MEKKKISLSGRTAAGIMLTVATLILVSLWQNAVLSQKQRPVVLIPEGNSRRTVLALGRSVKMQGEVSKSIIVVAGDVYVSGHVGGSVFVLGGTAVFMPTGHIDKSVVVIGGGLQQAAGARIAGRKVLVGLPSVSSPWGAFGYRWRFPSSLFASRLSGGSRAVLRLMNDLIFGGLLLILMPGLINRLAGSFGPNLLRFTVLGIIGYPIIIMAIVLVGLSIVGLPLAALAFLGLALVKQIGRAAMAVFVGCQAWNLATRKVGSTAGLFSGLIIMFAVSRIPPIGRMISVLTSLVSVGALIDLRFGGDKPWLPPRADQYH